MECGFNPMACLFPTDPNGTPMVLLEEGDHYARYKYGKHDVTIEWSEPSEEACSQFMRATNELMYAKLHGLPSPAEWEGKRKKKRR